MTTLAPPKIVVIGAGTSGITLFRALKYLGFTQTELLERNRTFQPEFAKTKGLVLDSSTLTAFNRLDRGLYQVCLCFFANMIVNSRPSHVNSSSTCRTS